LISDWQTLIGHASIGFIFSTSANLMEHYLLPKVHFFQAVLHKTNEIISLLLN